MISVLSRGLGTAFLVAALVFTGCKETTRPSPNATWEVQYQSPLSKQYSGTSLLGLFSYNSISVVSPAVAFVAADYPRPENREDRYGLVLRTTDGGANWVELPVGAPGLKVYVLNSIQFINGTMGWVAGLDSSKQPVVLKTTDSGATWEGYRTEYQQTPTAIYFLDSQNGWMVGVTSDPEDEGDGGPSDILTTADGGKSWQSRMRIPVSMTEIFFVDSTTGWAGGHKGAIYSTRDGGRTWIGQRSGLEPPAGLQVQLPADYLVNGIHFVDQKRGWAAARPVEDAGGVILGTADGGASWSPLVRSVDEKVRDVHFATPLEGWSTRSGSQYIYHSVDGGQQWQTESVTFEQRPSIYAISGSGPSHVWAVGGGAIFFRVAK